MCGIAGVLGLPSLANEKRLHDAASSMRHRGPNALGTQIVCSRTSAIPAGLAHTRLAILDLSPRAHQPMQDHVPDRSPNWIAYNGEIYNFRSLRAELSALGHEFVTQSDTEVILAGYRQWGLGLVDRLRGMFAWCLLDPDQGRAWLCRDRFGIKPLYYFRVPDAGIVFASELKTLLCLGDGLISRSLSVPVLENYLEFGSVWTRNSLIEGVQSLEPATSIVTDWDGRIVTEHKYWCLSPHRSRIRREEAPALIREQLERSVSEHLVSDAPIGFFLSSGIDSNALALLSRSQQNCNLNALTVSVDDEAMDEADIAKVMAEKVGLKHRVVRLTKDNIVDSYPDYLEAMGHPTTDGLNTYIVSGAAAKSGMKVALSGLGADELFAGYSTFRVLRLMRYAGFGSPRLSRLYGKLLRPLLADYRWRRFLENKETELSPLALLYLKYRTVFDAEQRRLLRGGMLSAEPNDRLAGPFANSDPVNTLSGLELSQYMRYVLLADADTFSMRHSLEIRVPYLDHELVGLVASLPGRWKLVRRSKKKLLADAVNDRALYALERMPKRGFSFPWDHWLSGRLADPVRDLLADRATWVGAGIDPTIPPSMFERFKRGDPRLTAHHILTLSSLSHFVRKYSLSAGSSRAEIDPVDHMALSRT